MDSLTEIESINIGLIAHPDDDLNQLIKMAFHIQRPPYLVPNIIICNPMLYTDLLPGDPFIGIPTLPSITKRSLNQNMINTCTLHKEIDMLLNNNIMQKQKINVEFISDYSNQIISYLESKYQFLLIPHSFQSIMMCRLISPNLNRHLVKSKKFCIFICDQARPWKNIVVIQNYNTMTKREELLLTSLQNSFSLKPHSLPLVNFSSKALENIFKKVSLSKENQNHQMDNNIISTDNQQDTILAVHSKVAISMFRFRKMKHFMKQWRGGLLIYP